MAEFILKVIDKSIVRVKANERDSANYQCFYTLRRNQLSFTANYKVKLTDSYKEIKHNSRLWNYLLLYVSQL